MAEKIKIVEVKEKAAWEDFFSTCEEKTFLTSWNWGEFQKSMRNKVWRLGAYEEKSGLIGAALVIKIIARRGTFLFIPHGPVVKNGTERFCLEIFLKELKKIAKEERADFIRFAPISTKNEENAKVFGDFGFRNAPIHMHPELTWELDITPTEEKIFQGMRKTTRYLIRQAQKNNDVTIEKSFDLNGVEKFNELYQSTVNRQQFVAFSLDYLKNEFLAFSPDNQISLIFGKYRGEIISGGIFVLWQGTGFYHHGAASLKYPKIPASYLALWEAIKEAKSQGCKKFNFWGIAPKNDAKNHPWAGLTLFKMGFGGYKKEYVKTQDLPISSKYWLNYIVERLRKAKRGL